MAGEFTSTSSCIFKLLRGAHLSLFSCIYNHYDNTKIKYDTAVLILFDFRPEKISANGQYPTRLVVSLPPRTLSTYVNILAIHNDVSFKKILFFWSAMLYIITSALTLSEGLVSGVATLLDSRVAMATQ